MVGLTMKTVCQVEKALSHDLKDRDVNDLKAFY
jgi:hypothetical protein